MKLTGHIDLPPHRKPGGFDHAAIHAPSGMLYVAHTCNDALDVVDIRENRLAATVEGLAGVAGALVSEEANLVFTSNRGDDSVGIFPPGRPQDLFRVGVGVRPNGLAFDSKRGLLLAATLGDVTGPRPPGVTIVDVTSRKATAEYATPGKTRWTVFDATSGNFFVNIGSPSQISVFGARGLKTSFHIPCAGAHGLDIDGPDRRLFCACDGGELVTLSADDGRVLSREPISGIPDVVWFHPGLKRLYVAIADPGVVDVFDTDSMKRLDTVATEKGAKTTALDLSGNRLFVFLPETHRAAVFTDL